MTRNVLLRPGVARAIVALQVVPILAMRPRSYVLSSQEWWLAALLAALAALSAFQVLFRKTYAPWPWYLFSFAQGFSVISKLMMLMPHASTMVDGVQRMDVAYVVLSLCSMAASGFVIWYFEQPDVRNVLLAARGRSAGEPKTN